MRNALRDGLLLTTFGVVLSTVLARALAPTPPAPSAPTNGLDQARALPPAPRRF